MAGEEPSNPGGLSGQAAALPGEPQPYSGEPLPAYPYGPPEPGERPVQPDSARFSDEQRRHQLRGIQEAAAHGTAPDRYQRDVWAEHAARLGFGDLPVAAAPRSPEPPADVRGELRRIHEDHMAGRYVPPEREDFFDREGEAHGYDVLSAYLPTAVGRSAVLPPLVQPIVVAPQVWPQAGPQTGAGRAHVPGAAPGHGVVPPQGLSPNQGPARGNLPPPQAVAAAAARVKEKGFWVAFREVGLRNTVKSLSALLLIGRKKEVASGAGVTKGAVAGRMIVTMVAGGAARITIDAFTTGLSATTISAGVGAGMALATGRKELAQYAGENWRARLGAKVGLLGRGALFGVIGAEIAPFVAEGVGNLAEGIGGLFDGGAPEAPPVDLTPPEPQIPEHLQTEALGQWDGHYNADTNYYNGTGYNSIAHSMMGLYQDSTGNPLNWQDLRYNTPGFEPAYHDFVGRVLEANGLSWEDARHMSSDATLDIPPDAIRDFAGKLGELTDGRIDADNFSVVEAGTPDAAGLEQVSAAAAQEMSGEMVGYLNSLDDATRQALLIDARDGSLSPESMRMIQEGFAQYLLAGEAGQAIAADFGTHLETTPPPASVIPDQYVDQYLADSAAYYAVADAGVRAAIHQLLLDQLNAALASANA